jgi:hypothetical protein
VRKLTLQSVVRQIANITKHKQIEDYEIVAPTPYQYVVDDNNAPVAAKGQIIVIINYKEKIDEELPVP